MLSQRAPIAQKGASLVIFFIKALFIIKLTEKEQLCWPKGKQWSKSGHILAIVLLNNF